MSAVTFSGPLLQFAAVLLAASIMSWLLVGLLRRYALRRQILDHPGERASHSRPTPRAGGPAIALVILAAGVGAFYVEKRDWSLVFALLGLGFVAWVGWMDDRRSLAVMPRLAAHLLAACFVVPLALTLRPAAGVATCLAVTWWAFWGVSSINVVNFMDGIDGLIGAQMVVFGVHLAVHANGQTEAVIFAAGLVGAALGFLWWNWEPAKIFMGDSGSGALGLACVVGGLLVLRNGGGLVATFLPLYPIFLDATVTLIHRATRGERITEAHRSHLYQRLANGGLGHAPVTLLYAGAAAAAIPISLASPGSRIPVFAGYGLLVAVAGVLFSRRASGGGEARP